MVGRQHSLEQLDDASAIVAVTIAAPDAAPPNAIAFDTGATISVIVTYDRHMFTEPLTDNGQRMSILDKELPSSTLMAMVGTSPVVIKFVGDVPTIAKKSGLMLCKNILGMDLQTIAIRPSMRHLTRRKQCQKEGQTTRQTRAMTSGKLQERRTQSKEALQKYDCFQDNRQIQSATQAYNGLDPQFSNRSGTLH